MRSFRTCPYVQRVVSKDDELENINADDLVVFRNDVSYHHKEALMIRSDVIHDPTLSRTTEYTCNNCPNHEAVFWQLPESQQTNATALIFVCTAQRAQHGGSRGRNRSRLSVTIIDILANTSLFTTHRLSVYMECPAIALDEGQLLLAVPHPVPTECAVLAEGVALARRPRMQQQ
ncbi:DNA-directed RNA polymerase II subunit RPB9 [Perkinsus olseni]|uniref:DNA-directed RNA polymerase II subunit RPB9 n=1 Tax=Perkinsus olseni TaxID=32597 RepID=A0A7J6TBE4_PEROL|nr:DNA-directed RNA polymerase II subunit RPB9 [Perkinsus olseni]